jgi:hypothetical protein
MKIYIYIFIIAISKVDLYLLQNHNIKICANCKFFISNKNKCNKFGNIDIITGKYNYEDAIEVKNDYDKCDEDAIFYKKNYFKFISISFNFILENNLSIFLFCYFTFPIMLVWLFDSYHK